MNSRKYCKIVVDALQDKKGNDIKVIDIKEISSMGDYFIIADGSNRKHVHAMWDTVEEDLSAEGAKQKNREGYANGGWILLDYYYIIVHIFSEEERNFYDLEHIWRDGILVQLGDL